ncbi:hypothetical protein OLF86_10635, partial [Streptococcus pneumoniae]|nr:hypothetical protein [Streptococcus pneumoniae]
IAARVAARPAPACACTARLAPRRAPRYAAAAHRRPTLRRNRGHGSEMAEAMYWMRTLSGLDGAMGESMGGFSLGGLAGLMP